MWHLSAFACYVKIFIQGQFNEIAVDGYHYKLMNIVFFVAVDKLEGMAYAFFYVVFREEFNFFPHE
jgi:hypothetical protein